MELRILILSVACFSCMMPPALGSILAAKAVAKGVLIAKGALLAKAALAAKGAVKGVLAAKVAALAKGALIAKGALAAKGALVAKGVLAAEEVLAAKKALAAKGVLLAKGAAAALAAKGAAVVGAKIAAVKGAALLAKAAAAKGAALVAAKGAAAVAAKKAILNGLLGAKVAAASGLIHNTFADIEPQPLGVPVESLLAIPVVPPAHEVQLEAVELPSIAGRIAQWAEAIQGSLVETSSAAADLTRALGLRTAAVSAPTVVYDYGMVKAPRFYPAPVIEKVETVY